MTLRQVCDVRRLTELSTRCPATINEWTLDGPAGIPDSIGNLNYPPVAQRYATPVPVQGSVVQEVSTGVYQTVAYPLPPEVAAGIQFRVGPGEKPPIPPNFCRVPVQEAHEAIAAGAQNLWFIGGPATSQGDAVEAERYAREKGLAYLPTVDCWPGVYSLQTIGNVGAALQIQQPASGQTVNRAIPIVGTAPLRSRPSRVLPLLHSRRSIRRLDAFGHAASQHGGQRPVGDAACRLAAPGQLCAAARSCWRGQNRASDRCRLRRSVKPMLLSPRRRM